MSTTTTEVADTTSVTPCPPWCHPHDRCDQDEGLHTLRLPSGVEVEQSCGSLGIVLPDVPTTGHDITTGAAWAMAVDLLTARELIRNPTMTAEQVRALSIAVEGHVAVALRNVR